tara:strand:- start:11821 stop:12315 length:495 start_codon:yes stop_codon:yes gene_type:complete
MTGEDIETTQNIRAEKPQPTMPPLPPEYSDIKEMKDLVQKTVDDQTKKFKDLPTPAAFATLENDVKHLWNYFKSLAAIAITIVTIIAGISVTLYLSMDNKLSTLNEKIEMTSKDIDARNRLLEGRLLEDLRDLNSRVNEVIISNSTNGTYNKKIELPATQPSAN